jgi:hypothetical protein
LVVRPNKASLLKLDQSRISCWNQDLSLSHLQQA